MTLPFCPQGLRRKAVWGPKRTIAALLLLAFGLSTNAMAADRNGRRSNPRAKQASHETRHRAQGTKAQPAAPNSRVRNYKFDNEVERRIRQGNPDRTLTRVIVTMLPGAKLPAELRRFARANGKLDIINGEVLELSSRMIKELERHPDVFRVHYDRPAGKENYRTS